MLKFLFRAVCAHTISNNLAVRSSLTHEYWKLECEQIFFSRLPGLMLRTDWILQVFASCAQEIPCPTWLRQQDHWGIIFIIECSSRNIIALPMIRPEDDLGSILDLQASSFHLPEMRKYKNCSAWAKLNTKKVYATPQTKLLGKM